LVVVVGSSKKTLPQMPIDHPISSRPAFISHLIMREGKAQNANSRRKHSLFPKDATRLLLVGRQFRCGKRKDLSRYHLEEKAGSRLRSLIRRVTPEEREDAQKLKAL
jgi:hypothetical protein